MTSNPQHELGAEDAIEAPQENVTPIDSEPTKSGDEADAGKLRDDLLRALAEIENTRRRGERAAQDARAYAIDRFARDILPVADTLSRALAAAPAPDGLDEATRTLLAGIEMTEKALIDVFARHGLKRFGAKGDAFDPNLHQAVAQAPSSAPAGAVADVMQPGYALGDRTLRAALVVVSTGPAASSGPSPGVSSGGDTSGHVDIKV